MVSGFRVRLQSDTCFRAAYLSGLVRRRCPLPSAFMT